MFFFQDNKTSFSITRQISLTKENEWYCMFLDTAYLRVSCVQFTLQRISELSSTSRSTHSANSSVFFFLPFSFQLSDFRPAFIKSLGRELYYSGWCVGVRGWRSGHWCLREEMKYRIDIKKFKSKALWLYGSVKQWSYFLNPVFPGWKVIYS